jgi:hypothetical protein
MSTHAQAFFIRRLGEDSLLLIFTSLGLFHVAFSPMLSGEKDNHTDALTITTIHAKKPDFNFYLSIPKATMCGTWAEML